MPIEHAPPTPALFAQAEALAEPLRSKVLTTLEEQASAARLDAAAIQALKERTSPTPLLLVPRFERDVHELSALWRTGRYLLDEERL